MRVALAALDDPQPMTLKARVLWTTALGCLTLLTIVAFFNRKQPLPAVYGLTFAHAISLSTVCGVTALMLFFHARRTSVRGYVVLAGTYLYVSGVLLAFAFTFPASTSSTTEPLWGNSDAAATLFIMWRTALIGGVIGGTIVLRRDRLRHRRPRLTHDIPLALGCTALALLATAGWTYGLPQSLPMIFDGNLQSAAGGDIAFVIAVAAAAGTAITGFALRDGTVINRWLFAVMFVSLNEAVVSIGADRYSLGWYYGRAVGFVALSVLLAALVWSMDSIGRRTTELATSDWLTGLESRASLHDNVAREVARAHQCDTVIGMLWIDLDDFKSINDQMGHQAGDQVLQEIAQRLAGHVRQADHVSRMGGDEFGVLLCDDVTPEFVEGVARRILEAVREPIRVDDSDFVTTASIGMATTNSVCRAPEELLSRADLAMYRAKLKGGDQALWFTPDLQSDATQRAAAKHDLSAALRQSNFDLDYQPIVSPATGRTCGVEALVRWVRKGVRIPAQQYIGLLEDTGQMLTLGSMVLDHLEQDAPEILGLAADGFFIDVNLSVRELVDDGLVDRLVAGPLCPYASSVIIEITESQDLEHATKAVVNLQRLRRAGYRVAIDDFGAGFSNFTRMEQLRPGMLKLDRSLVERAASGVEGGLSFLGAAVSIGMSLDCDVVAEGVETQNEARVIKDFGVPYAQGYLYASPMSKERLLAALRRAA